MSKNFILVFKSLLEQSGKMQKDICAELGISKQKLTNWKAGYTEPNLDDIVLLANYFNVSTDYLIGLEDEFGSKTGNLKPNTEKSISKKQQKFLDALKDIEIETYPDKEIDVLIDNLTNTAISLAKLRTYSGKTLNVTHKNYLSEARQKKDSNDK